ncbi:MAG: hypothetical protein HY060_11910 [Proteobacteria bacterium]|nr:hypothetical protein [Pseudomonadota bacterium]
MSDTRSPRIDLERAKHGPTAEDLKAMPATMAADWADATVILPVDRDIFEEAAAKQRVRAAQAAKNPGDRKKDQGTRARKKVGR